MYLLFIRKLHGKNALMLNPLKSLLSANTILDESLSTKTLIALLRHILLCQDAYYIANELFWILI